MKNLTQKIISAALSLVIAGGAAVTSSAAVIKYGDVNNDGKIDSSDALSVLEHSIGKAVLEDDAFTRADVNGDKKVNASDALDILRYSVGLTDTFDVCPPAKPTTKDGILNYYSKAIEKAKTAKPKYLLETNSQCVDADVIVKDPLGLLKSAGGVSAEDMAKQMEDELLQPVNPTSTVVAQGSYSSYINLPASCTLTDSSKLKSITLTTLSNGNYRIKIELYDEKNPKADSTVCKVMGVADYDSVLEQLESEANVEGAEGMTDISLDELSYKNLWITCEINPDNFQIVNYECNADIYNANTIEVFAILETITVKTKVTSSTSCKYSNFTY